MQLCVSNIYWNRVTYANDNFQKKIDICTDKKYLQNNARKLSIILRHNVWQVYYTESTLEKVTLNKLSKTQLSV